MGFARPKVTRGNLPDYLSSEGSNRPPKPSPQFFIFKQFITFRKIPLSAKIKNEKFPPKTPADLFHARGECKNILLFDIH
jgi:hypothetical protein